VERARKVQRDFLANVSHELKTPLTSLIGFSQALVDGSLLSDAERARAATIIHEESERVLRMAQELLDLARVEAGSISMHITAVDLGGQLQQELEMVRPRAEGRSLSLKLNVPDDIPPVAADPERLHQILDNLLDNAVKYAPDGEVIVVRTARTDDEVRIEVADRGPGIDESERRRIFEKFYRSAASRALAPSGTGLGLYICGELVERMGGRITVESETGSGSTFAITLPAAP
jgi:signal transduction histidine kinase